MAGVVAMASVIEDFDTQPCKKSRKDGGSPVVKTITNYFAPVAKPAEKPFSPPRSNNIMDYFSKRPSSSKEKSSPSEQSKENCQTSRSAEKHSASEASVKPASQKRGRKAVKAARKLVVAEPVDPAEDGSCVIVEEPKESKDCEEVVTSGSGMLGSDTAALLSQLSAEASVAAEESDVSACVEQTGKDETDEQRSTASVPRVKDKAKPVKTGARTVKKKHKQDSKQPEPEEKVLDTAMCEDDTEGDEVSQSKNSTVTISFQDFLRSQSEDRDEEGAGDAQGQDEQSKMTTESEEVTNDPLKNMATEEPVLQVSPRTLTIQAQVHVSPRQEAVKAVGKVASIFSKRKAPVSPAESPSVLQAETEHQPASNSLGVKRKSNVVLQEEDLELAVLESELMPKCSQAERKQFMAAFKQPGVDGSKPKPGKSQGKQKQNGENSSETSDKADEDGDVIPLAAEQVPPTSPENTVAKKKPQMKNKKKTKRVKKTDSGTDAPPPPPVEEAAVTITDDAEEEPAIPAVRRSRREAGVKQGAETTTTTTTTTTTPPIRKTRKLKETKDAATLSSPVARAETSKLKTPKRKRGVFVAQIVCPPDAKESPIRIKFTRIHRKSKAESEGGLDTSAKESTSKESKKRKQAKKLVEKAKVIQQSKKTAMKEKSTVRRSSRKETSVKKSYCENEDSIICLEEEENGASQRAPGKRKNVRSLNDVLGKATGKDIKAGPGCKSLEKSVRRGSAVISIFDDGSREDSENSQDDEQFKARREFLKSGLPDSFRKQIARTAASKEAYSLSCSSFHSVVHVEQPPNDCPLWNPPWPESPLLLRLKELQSQTSGFPSISGSLSLTTKPAHLVVCDRGSGWRPEISESVRQHLVEEVRDSNPSFPIQMFNSCFLKRRSEHQLHTSPSPETAPPVGGKRKRIEDEGVNTVKVAKKQRSSPSEESVSPCEPKPAKRKGRPRRTLRSKPEKDLGNVPAPILLDDDSVIAVASTVEKDVAREDVLWTEKYQPQHSSDIIGNSATVRRLHSWLKEWKLRADRDERRKQKDKKQEEGNNDTDWDCGEEDPQDAEDTLCNTMLITGPTGVGKTAAVYACAQELGFKVFEVNASSQRSGRLILSQLREATQSHQVDSQGVNAHKPSYFNSYSASSRPGCSPRKINSPRRVVSSPRKRPQSPRGARKGALAPTSLANFFKMGRPAMDTKEPVNAKNEQTAAPKKVPKTNVAEKPKASTCTTPKDNGEEQGKKMATSLILFEEVDVIFDEDSGFLAAIKTFMTTTKRPVILTTSDPAFSNTFDGFFEEILFKTPSVVNASSFLQLLCLAENVRTDPSDIGTLLRLNGCDIRQSMLQLQFWARTAGGRRVTKPLTNAELKSQKDKEAAETSLPPCDSGCTESRLGLLNIEPEGDIWERLKSQSLEETPSWELLMDSRRRGVDLLYSNMERLLPLPLTELTSSRRTPARASSESQDPPGPVDTKDPPSSACVPPDALPSHARLLQEAGDFSDDGSPVKVSSRMKKNKRRQCAPGQGGLDSDTDSDDSFVSLSKPRAPEVPQKLVSKTVKRKPLTPREQIKSLPVSQCLTSIADFLDNMSYLDSSLHVHSERRDIPGRTTPVGAVVKDGMTDESRLETEKASWSRGEDVLEVQTAVEALSFHRCRRSVAEAWDRAQQLEGDLAQEAAEELTLPVAPFRKGHSLCQEGPCQPELVQERTEVIESLMLKGVVGNRSAAALDYLPVLRTICRSEQLKEKGKVKRRFLHYLDGIHLGLDKTTLQTLAEDFP